MKFFKSLMFIAVAAMAFTACQKEEGVAEQTGVKVDFTTVANDTRTHFGEADGSKYPTLWTGNETVAVSLNYASQVEANVTASEDFKTANFNATLEGVSIDKHNAAGYVVPEGYNTVTNTGALFQQPVFRPLAGLGTTGGESFTGNNGTYHIYLPEYGNVGEGAIPAVMTVTIDGEDYELHFKDYANDDPFNVVRNHYYQYTIMGIDKETGVKVSLQYEVVDWSPVENPELSFE